MVFKTLLNMFKIFNEDSSSRSKSTALTVATTPVVFDVIGAIGLSTTTPYCIIWVDGDEVHRTDTLDDDSPIWTIATKSTCLIQVPAPVVKPIEAKTIDEITVTIHSGSECIGRTELSFEEVLAGQGKRKEYSVIPTIPDQKDLPCATLALRFRPAVPYDMSFLAGNIPKQDGLASDINFQSVRGPQRFMKQRKTVRSIDYFRTKPYPDPERTEETAWLSRQGLQNAMMKPSHRWVDIGQGELGSIDLEILGCKNLPNMDLAVSDATDAFVAIACEDNMVRTNVIWDELSPQWMPWTTRAFSFKLRHPTSLIFLGVFDYDELPLKMYDPIGRVVINTSSFHSNTEYILHYKLQHTSAMKGTDEDRGTIMLRLKINWADESEAMKMSFIPPKRFLVNVDNAKSHHVLRYLTHGSIDMDTASIETIKLSVAELKSCLPDMFFILDVVAQILLWRGIIRTTSSHRFWFPIQSIALFVAAASAVQRPDLIVSIFLYGVAWTLLSINFYQSRHPYPWLRVKKSGDINLMATFGISLNFSTPIVPHEGVREREEKDKLDQLRARRTEELVMAFVAFIVKVVNIYGKSDAADIKMVSKGYSWSLLADKLAPINSALQSVCKLLRMFRAFALGKTYAADVFSVNCIMVATLLILFPPAVVLLWSARIAVWVLLGPWVKIIDILYVSKWYETTEELVERMREGRSEDKFRLPDFDCLLESKTIQAVCKQGRIMAEKAIKCKAMRTHLYGSYCEAVPSVDSSRFPSVPLSTSSAKPCSSEPKKKEKLYGIHGQLLDDSILPLVGSAQFTN